MPVSLCPQPNPTPQPGDTTLQCTPQVQAAGSRPPATWWFRLSRLVQRPMCQTVCVTLVTAEIVSREARRKRPFEEPQPSHAPTRSHLMPCDVPIHCPGGRAAGATGQTLVPGALVPVAGRLDHPVLRQAGCQHFGNAFDGHRIMFPLKGEE